MPAQAGTLVGYLDAGTCYWNMLHPVDELPGKPRVGRCQCEDTSWLAESFRIAVGIGFGRQVRQLMWDLLSICIAHADLDDDDDVAVGVPWTRRLMEPKCCSRLSLGRCNADY